jgi:uncharacterized membrane protein YccC
MDSTVMSRATEANDVLTAQADERLAHAYDQIARADEQLARLTAQLGRMEQETAPHRSAIPPSALLRQRRPSRGRPALRGFIGLLAATCIIGAALMSQSSYGEAARPIIARWAAPYVGSVSWPQSTNDELPAGPGPSSVRLSSAEAAPALATLAAPAAPQGNASPAVLSSSELTQLLQTMARDLSTLQQGIEQLKASQERLASDNAKAAEQFRESQAQLARLVAKGSEKASEKAPEPDPRARTAAPPPRPIAEPARRPAPAQASSQARAQPLQLQPAPR